MKSSYQVLPLAIGMMAGPQIISSFILVTGRYAVKSSLAYVSAIAIATITGVGVLLAVFTLLGIDTLTQEDSQQSPAARIIETGLVALLIIKSIQTYVRRATIKPPKWMKVLQEAQPFASFKIGLMLIFLMPTDIVIMITVALHLISTGSSFATALPFIGTTTLMAGFPLFVFILFRQQAEKAMPGVQRWIDNHSWLIQISVYLLFVYLLLG